MVKVTIYKKSNNYVGYELKGHSQFAEQGEDIVCAGVSTLAQSTLIAINELVTEKIKYDVESGYLKVNYPTDINEKQKADVNLLTEAMKLGLREMEKQYGKHMRISVISI